MFNIRELYGMIVSHNNRKTEELTQIKHNLKQILLFLLTGGLNTLLGYGVFFLFVTVNVPYQIAYTLSTIVGVAINYYTYSGIVFKRRGKREAVLFVASYGITYIVGLFALRTLILMRIETRIAGAINIVLTAGVSFVLQKTIVFRSKKNEAN